MRMIRTYTELMKYRTIEERFQYLSLRERVGNTTFGFDRYINQAFYTSSEWRNLRHHIIARDNACDLGIEGYEIHSRIYIHHLNPMTPDDIIASDDRILDPEYLISTTHLTHNAVHFGDASLLPKALVERRPGDTKLW